MIKKIWCLFVIVFSILTASEQKIGIKTGIGFEFQTIGPLFAALSNSSSSGGSLYLPMQTDKFMIEPNLYYNYQSKNVGNLEEYESNFMFNIGLFSIKYRSDKLKTYSGFRLGMAIGKEKTLYISSNEQKTKAFLFGPSVGAEFFMSDYLSFGGECTLRVIKGEKEGYDYQGNNETEKESVSMLTPTLMIRFYF